MDLYRNEITGKLAEYAVKKYKLSQFAFIILELFPKVITKENNKWLLLEFNNVDIVAPL